MPVARGVAANSLLSVQPAEYPRVGNKPPNIDPNDGTELYLLRWAADCLERPLVDTKRLHQATRRKPRRTGGTHSMHELLLRCVGGPNLGVLNGLGCGEKLG